MRRVPRLLAHAVDDDARQHPERRAWLAGLPETIDRLASEWELEVGEPYDPGGTAAWIAPARRTGEERLVLKVGWRHMEAEHEADALGLWDGDGAVRCLATRRLGATLALLLERCEPGRHLKSTLPEEKQDVVIAGLLRRLWEHRPRDTDPFRSLATMCAHWASSSEAELAAGARGLDPGLVRHALALLQDLPASAEQDVLLCTDLHAENVLSARREPWLAIDPKPFVGDAAFDPVQHMLNCDRRLVTDPRAMARRMAELLDLDVERVRLWLFARCAQEGLHDPTMREPARRLAGDG